MFNQVLVVSFRACEAIFDRGIVAAKGKKKYCLDNNEQPHC